VRRSGVGTLVTFVVLVGVAVGSVLAAGWRPLLGLDLQGGVSVVLAPTAPAEDAAIDQALEVIRNRVDSLGVAEPDITRQGDTVVVQLPGVKDQQRALDLVGTTAELRFRPVLAAVPAGAVTGEPDPSTTSTTSTTAPVTTDPAAATTTTAVPSSSTTSSVPAGTPIADLVYPLTPREGDLADASVNLPQLDSETGEETIRYQLGPALVTGDALSADPADIVASVRPDTGEWYVQIAFADGPENIDRWRSAATLCFSGDPTTCPQRQLAIVLDGRVLSAPVVQDTFADTTEATISGQFTQAEAQDLARVLRYGALPVEFERQESKQVSATIGRDALRAGVIAGIVGLVLVALYLLVLYRLLALVALGSLLLSFGLLWSTISWLGETRGLALTLAGVTGIIVSIGVSVDSNIVYAEQLKDDLAGGRSVHSAGERAFRTAFRTIVRADVVSLIGAGLLYWLTVGPVRGFAFYLGLSTVLDLVASWFFMRPAVALLTRSDRIARRPGLLGVAMDRRSGEVTA
jgi:preprotein translocase subunit SecD